MGKEHQEENYHPSNLEARLKEILPSGVTFGICFKSLTGEAPSLVINLREKFPAASVGKVFIAAAALKEIEEGERRFVDQLKVTFDDFKKGGYGTGALYPFFKPEYKLDRALRKRGSTILATVSLGGMLRHMINQSDNLAALKVAEFIGRGRIQERIANWGFLDTTIYDPERGTENLTTPLDLGRFFELLWRGEVIKDETNLNRFLGWMTFTDVEDRIPRGVPKKVKAVVYHKPGQLKEDKLSFYHDAGIVKLPGGQAYVLVVLTRAPFTKEKDQKKKQVEGIQDISRVCFELTCEF